MDQMPNTVDDFVQVLTSGPTLHWTGRDRNLQSTPEQKILLKALINEFNSCEDPQVRFMAVASFLVKCSDIEAEIGLVTKYDIIRRYSETLYFLADYPTGDDDHTASLATGVLRWCAETLIKLRWAEKFPTSKKRDQKAGKVWEKLGKEHERKVRDLLLVEEKCVNAFLRTTSGLGSPGDLLSNPAAVGQGGETPIEYAAQREGSQQMVALLQQHKAKAMEIVQAAFAGRMADVQLVCQYAPEKVNDKDRYGNTALHWAAANNSLEIAQLLLASKATVGVQNNDGETPLEWAQNYGSQQMVALLQQHEQ